MNINTTNIDMLVMVQNEEKDSKQNQEAATILSKMTSFDEKMDIARLTRMTSLSRLPSLERFASNPLIRGYSDGFVQDESAHFVPFGPEHKAIAKAPSNSSQFKFVDKVLADMKGNPVPPPTQTQTQTRAQTQMQSVLPPPVPPTFTKSDLAAKIESALYAANTEHPQNRLYNIDTLTPINVAYYPIMYCGIPVVVRYHY
eukprot:CAMPEP_0202692464 /NCGR_PEP_ID=MMETSP1385-20130828/6832_1 /ASSEMBLY_ACC=CAM_ASM_000861 /TAXON_ID=933848 /ORGANISM="Elphidium margaritaceum" /LENGTH=199 /DNA_ID=CAMNT_0049347997 /DNA_START=82 /DNA_END=681 /DNA_ORIENTATION=-